MRVGAFSYIGESRRENQDRYAVLPNLWMVADGMGGCNGGAQAASTAVQVVGDSPFDPERPTQSLLEAMQRANTVIYNQAGADASLKGMGTTLTVGYLVENTLYIGHVGDSRIYLIRGDEIRQLTQDHSFVGELVRDGTISPAEAVSHPNRNILTRAIGVSPEIQIDITQEELQLDDILVFCTDGVSGVLSPEEIRQVVQQAPEPQIAAQTLCHRAEEQGSTDNSTAIVVHLLPPDEGGFQEEEFELENLLQEELTLS